MAQKLKDLLNLSYETVVELTKKGNIDSFKSVVKYMAQSANRRINTLLKSPIGEFSPAYKKLKDAGIDKFDTKWINKATSKDVGKLLNLYSNTKQFLKAKTSKLQGWQKVRSQVKKRTKSAKMFSKEYKSKRQATIWINREKKFWKLYNRLVDEYGGIISELDSERIQKMLYRIQSMKGIQKGEDEIQAIMEKYIDELYRAKMKGKNLNDTDFEDDIRIIYKK